MKLVAKWKLGDGECHEAKQIRDGRNGIIGSTRHRKIHAHTHKIGECKYIDYLRS